MKSLPLLPLAAVIALGAGCLWLTATSGRAQDASGGGTGPAAEARPADTQSPSATGTTGQSTLRRNEKSAASALVTLEQARERLYGYVSLKAQIVESVAIGTRRFRMEGSYLQGSDLKLRLEYGLKVGSTEATLLEVCDGQILWTHHRLGSTERVTRRNVRQIIGALNAAGHTTQNTLTAELGLGGLPGLVASIQRSVAFEHQWDQDVHEQTFVVIEGGWKSSYRDRLLGAGAPETQPLPEHVPDRIRIYFERDSLFPRRVMYLKRDSRNVHHPMVTLDFVEVEWNGAVDESLFTFTPPDRIQVDDVTQSYTGQITPAAKPASSVPEGRSTPDAQRQAP